MKKGKVCSVCNLINSEFEILCILCSSDLINQKIEFISEDLIEPKKICPKCKNINEINEKKCLKCDYDIENIEYSYFKKITEKKNINDLILSPINNPFEKLLIPHDREVVLGREGDIMPETFRDFKTVSRKHIVVKYEDDKWKIKDISNTNFTYINGKQIKKGEYYEINVGDIISLSTKFQLKVEKK